MLALNEKKVLNTNCKEGRGAEGQRLTRSLGEHWSILENLACDRKNDEEGNEGDGLRAQEEAPVDLHEGTCRGQHASM